MKKALLLILVMILIGTVGYRFLEGWPLLDGFYMTGLWVKGFGVPMAAAGGREVMQQLCKADGRQFRTG